jgi:hypothetical protein
MRAKNETIANDSGLDKSFTLNSTVDSITGQNTTSFLNGVRYCGLAD